MFEFFKRKNKKTDSPTPRRKSFYELDILLPYQFYEIKDDNGEVVLVGKTTQDVKNRQRQHVVEFLYKSNN